MKKKYWLAIFLFILILGAYVFGSYVFVYRTINRANLKASNKQETYLINSTMKSEKIITYVALGDSLTAGVGVADYQESYPELLAQKIAGGKELALKPHAIPGAKTSDLIKNYLNPTIADKPDIITLLVGVNDVHQQISQEEFAKNYEEILKRLTEETEAKIYAINIPFIGAETLILPPYRYELESKTKEFNNIIKNLAEKYQVKYIDLYTPTLSQLKSPGDHYASDSFHPSAIGYAVWAQIIYDNLN